VQKRRLPILHAARARICVRLATCRDEVELETAYSFAEWLIEFARMA